MNKPVSIGARISEDIDDKLSKLAKATNRSKSWHVMQALEQYVAHEIDFIEKVQEGIRDIEEGRVHSHDDVMAEMEELIDSKR